MTPTDTLTDEILYRALADVVALYDSAHVALGPHEITLAKTAIAAAMSHTLDVLIERGPT